MSLRLSTNSGRCLQRLAPEDPNMVGTVLAPVCLLLLDAPECGNSFGSVLRRRWRRRGEGNSGDCQGDQLAGAPRSCRCRSWARNLSPVNEAQGFCLLLSNKVEDERVLIENR